jgi:hypothetical protein
MNQNPMIAVEWFISESTPGESSPIHPPVHMGPFVSEEECRALLTSLNQIPRFRHSNLEVHQRRKHREKRIRMELPVKICRISGGGKFWPACTVDISSLGARLTGLGEPVRPGDILEIRCEEREAVFKVVWVGPPGTPTEGHAGVECLTPETNIWKLDLSARMDDEPLLQEMAVARAVQGDLLPRQRPPLRTLDYSGNCVQARTVGGDYYDFLDMGPGQVGFVLADVAGKGIAAALLMASLQGSIHSWSGDDDSRDMPRLLSSVNDHLYRHTAQDRYATLFFGYYEDATRCLRYVNCGHNPPLLLRQGGQVERLAPTATVLGLFGKWECSVGETHLEAGNILSVFSDGITEASAQNGEEFGETRLLDLLRECRDLEVKAIIQNVEHAVEQFRSGEQQQDDITLMVGRAQ